MDTKEEITKLWTGEGHEARGSYLVTDTHLRDFAYTDAGIRSLLLQGCSVTDTGLGAIERFPLLEKLFLADLGIGDRGLTGLRSYSQLSFLGLPGCQCITSDSLDWITEHLELETLVLSNTAIGDNKLAALLKLRKVRSLSLEQTLVSSAVIPNLVNMRELRTLRLSGTLVTDDHLEVLCRLPHLRRLCLRDTKVGSRGIQALSACPELQTIELDGTLVDDAAVDAFTEMPSIEIVSVHRSKMSREGSLGLIAQRGCCVSFP